MGSRPGPRESVRVVSRTDVVEMSAMVLDSLVNTAFSFAQFCLPASDLAVKVW